MMAIVAGPDDAVAGGSADGLVSTLAVFTFPF